MKQTIETLISNLYAPDFTAATTHVPHQVRVIIRGDNKQQKAELNCDANTVFGGKTSSAFNLSYNVAKKVQAVLSSLFYMLRVSNAKTSHFVHVFYSCVPYDFYNKHLIFPFAELTDFLTEANSLLCEA